MQDRAITAADCALHSTGKLGCQRAGAFQEFSQIFRIVVIIAINPADLFPDTTDSGEVLFKLKWPDCHGYSPDKHDHRLWVDGPESHALVV